MVPTGSDCSPFFADASPSVPLLIRHLDNIVESPFFLWTWSIEPYTLMDAFYELGNGTSQHETLVYRNHVGIF